MGDDAGGGVLCRFSGVLRSGQSVVAAWKAYSVVGQAGLRWEIKRVLPAAAFCPQQNTKLWKVISDNFERWDAALTFRDSLPHFGRSRLSLTVSRQAKGIDNADQEHWLSSVGLLSLLAWWSVKRKEVVAREQCAQVLRLFVERTVAAESIVGEMLTWSLGARHMQECRNLPIVDNMCSCMHGFLGKPKPDMQSMSPQEFLAAKLRCLMPLAVHCSAARSWLASMVVSLAELVEQGMSQWGDFSWHTSSEALLRTAKRRRRADPHVKMMVAQTGDATHGSASAACVALDGVDRSVGLRWVQQEMAAFRAACFMSFGESQQLALCCDASRVGKPAREFLVGCLSDLRVGRHCVLPPQVVLSTTVAGRPARPHRWRQLDETSCVGQFAGRVG